MRNLKKFLALVLAMMMTLSLMVTVNASSFKDVEDTNTYVEAIDLLAALGVLKGQGADDAGQFQPKGTITRAEMAAVLYRVVTGDVGDKNVHLYDGYKAFTDLNDGAWYIPYVNYCENNGLINGVGGGKFEPQEKLTGYQALVMVLRAMGYNNPNEFSSSDWKLKASGYGRRLGITTNIAEGSLGAPIAREAVAEIVFQAIQKPTVSYNMLLGYTNDVLVAANKDGSGNWIYDHDVYNTLLYQIFGVVGKRTIMGNDGKYGRPIVEWVSDAPNDSVANGGKYIVNPQAADVIAADGSGAGVNGIKSGSGAEAGATYIPVSTPGATYATMGGANAYIADEDTTDVTEYKISLAPVKVYNTAVTECDLTKAINSDKSIPWASITEYVNGNEVEARDGIGDRTGANVLDKLHTSNTGTNNKSDYTIGAQGRQTEIYKYTENGKTKWVFVYIDTLLGEVEKVVPHTLDTNEHVMTQAELHIAINDTVKGSDALVIKQDANFSQKVGDLVLVTTYGMKGDTQVGNGDTDPVDINEAILAAVPSDKADFGTGAFTWQVEMASKSVKENAVVPTKIITVNATIGAATDKTGVLTTDSRYPTTWAYHIDHDGTVTDTVHTTVNVNKETVLDDLCVNVTNSIIGQTYTAALDKNGNIVGMWPGVANVMVGVLTESDYARIGLGKYAVEFEIFTTEGKTEAVRMLKTDGGAPEYFPDQDTADGEIKDNTPTAAIGTDTKVGNLVMLESYTKDGATYWKTIDFDASATAADDTAGDTKEDLYPGLGDGLKKNQRDLDEESVIIVAEYDFDYSAGTDDQGKNVNVRYSVYQGFRTLPYITTTEANNIMFQKLDNHGKYLYVYAADETKDYSFNKRPTIVIDDSFLVIAPIATYAEYSEYLVAKNGVETTIKVANINNNAGNTGLNEELQAAIRTKGLLVATGENSKGYITAVDEVKDMTGLADNLGGYTDTLIGKGKGLNHSKGVLSWEDSGTAAPYTYDKFLTVAENCIVKIVNVDLGKMFDGTLASIEQYQADHDIVFELDTNGWVSCLYIID